MLRERCYSLLYFSSLFRRLFLSLNSTGHRGMKGCRRAPFPLPSMSNVVRRTLEIAPSTNRWENERRSLSKKRRILHSSRTCYVFLDSFFALLRLLPFFSFSQLKKNWRNEREGSEHIPLHHTWKADELQRKDRRETRYSLFVNWEIKFSRFLNTPANCIFQGFLSLFKNKLVSNVQPPLKNLRIYYICFKAGKMK